MEEEVVNQTETFTQGLANAGEEFAVQTKNFWHVDEISQFMTWGNFFKVIIAVVSILVFYLAYRLIKRVIKKKLSLKFEKHTTMLLNKMVSYIFYVLIAMYILSLFGISFKAIWGAAGVAGLAIGFAAQTSVSNLISGLFVLGERTMKIGDFIQIGDVSGTVDNIGLLSIKIHTLDNQMIRIPNSSIINNNLMNFNQFPLRRFVFEVPVSYDSDMDKVLEALNKVPERCPSVLKDPEPSVFYDGFAEGIVVKIAVWFNRADLIKVKNEVYSNTVKVCREYDVEIPYEHFDIKILEDKEKKPATKKTVSKPQVKASAKTAAKAKK